MTIENQDWADDEVVWRKSSFSNPNGNECVEVAQREDVVGVRDSKNVAGGVLTFGAKPWRWFVDQLD